MSRRDGPRYYVLDGHEPKQVRSLIEWGRWMETADRRVARTDLLDGSWVSTVFLGLDHGWDGVPMLFETCIFLHRDTDDGEVGSEVTERYSTWAEAEVGHFELCEKLASALPAWKMKEQT